MTLDEALIIHEALRKSGDLKSFEVLESKAKDEYPHIQEALQLATEFLKDYSDI